MVGEDRVTMSGKELRRVHVLRQALEKNITQGQAGEALGLTARHIRRLLRRVQAEGMRGWCIVGGGSRGTGGGRRRLGLRSSDCMHAGMPIVGRR